jgi:hypothetical protein
MISGTSTSNTADQHGIFIQWMGNTIVAFNSVNLFGVKCSGNQLWTSPFRVIQKRVGVLNNIFSNRRSGFAMNLNIAQGITSDYNNLYTTGANLGRYLGVQVADLVAWQTISGMDSTSLSTDPYFFSMTDLHTFNTLLKGKGIPIVGVNVDFDGDLRDPVTPDIGADEFTPPALEASMAAILAPVEGCGLGMEDVTVRIANNGFAAISGGLTAWYSLSGGVPVSEVITATIPSGDTLTFTFATKADLSVTGSDSTFILTTYINLVGDPLLVNDTLRTDIWSGYLPPVPVVSTTTVNYGSSATLIAGGPGTKLWYYSPIDTIEFFTGDTLVTPILYDTITYYVESANNTFSPFSAGAFLITEMCHWRSSSVGNPSTGWPSYMIADDYIEISGVPSSDLAGITLQQYSTSGLLSSHTFPSGTLLSPAGTAIIAVGEMGNSTPSPANYYYHGNGTFTSSFGSGTTAGRVLRAPDGTIIDAVGYGNYQFPAVANVPASEWSNPITAGTGSTAGVRLIGTDMNTGVNWIVASNTNRQNPNIFNAGVPVPAPVSSGLCRSARVPATANVTAFPGIDAGIAHVIQPSGTVIAGTIQNLEVNLHNYGLNTLTSVTINWRLNNVLQAPFTWTGSLPHGASIPVTIATMPFPAGANCIKTWTSLPNGLPDNFNLNDTANRCFTSCLSGTFTIGPASAGSFDFNTFATAVSSLAAAGVCGPVIFDVYPGTYTEQVTIPKINGASAFNTITFRGSTADSTAVTLQHAATASALNWVVRLNQASFVTFRHMTIKATGTSWGVVVELMDSANNNTISNCIISTNITSTSSNFSGIYSTNNLSSNNLTVANNVIDGGYYGIFHYGTFSNTKTGLTVTGNTFSNFYYSGIYTYYVNNIHIEGNHLSNRANAQTMYVMHITYSYTPGVITRNRIVSANLSSYYGIYLAYNEGTTSNGWLVSNNFVSQTGNVNSTVYGIQSLGNWNMNFYNNSVSINSGTVSAGRAFQLSGGGQVNVVNNLFANFNGGYAAYYQSSWAVDVNNYNNYYTTGSNLVYYDYNHINLASLQTYSGTNLNSQNILPPFTAIHNLALTNTMLSGRATPLPEVLVDFFGSPRTTTPTIGAHEVPLLQNDAGVLAFLSPTGQLLLFEDDTVSVQVVLMNYGLDTLHTIPVTYTLNSGSPTSAVYNGMIPPFGTDTFTLPSYVTTAGNILVCAYTTVSGDTNHFNDTACIAQFAFSNIDAAVVDIAPMAEGCGLGQDTVRISIANVSTSVIPAGYTASYRRHPGSAIVTETVNTAIVPGDTIQYTFSTLINLATSADTTWLFTAWVTVLDDNLPINDTATRPYCHWRHLPHPPLQVLYPPPLAPPPSWMLTLPFIQNGIRTPQTLFR